MASILIKDIPKVLHKKLKELAQKHHRSMNKEVVVILKKAVAQEIYEVPELPPPLKGKFGLSHDFIDKAKRMGRA